MLYLVTGKDAPWAMLGIVAGAYGIGAIVRFNIVHAEPALHDNEVPRRLRLTERGSDLILTVAYVISVAFYIRLLAPFALDGIGIDGETPARLLTTVILVFIVVTGWWKGLKGLIQLEEYSVTIKLAVIAALLVGLAGFDPATIGAVPNLPPDQSWWEQARALAGLLLVVQGFETSRNLGQAFDANTRVRSMRLPQIISGIIYVGSIVLIMPLLFGAIAYHRRDDELVQRRRHRHRRGRRLDRGRNQTVRRLRLSVHCPDRHRSDLGQQNFRNYRVRFAGLCGVLRSTSIGRVAIDRAGGPAGPPMGFTDGSRTGGVSARLGHLLRHPGGVARRCRQLPDCPLSVHVTYVYVIDWKKR